MVKGSQRKETEFKKELFVGLTTVSVVAVNPSRSELNKLIGKDDSDEDKPIEYLSADNDGNDRLRLSFWLHDELRDKYFVHSFNLTKKDRTNKENTKIQVVNSTCTTTWVPFVNGTTKPDEALMPDWFKEFISKETKEVLGKKKWRTALSGEDELVTLLGAWLGKFNFKDPDSEVMVDVEKLFKQNYKELRGLIDGEWATPFVILVGVRTDENDSTKKYQQVWQKGFLPASFMKNINKGSFTNEYTKKVWSKFEAEATGQYGFDGYTELGPLSPYDETKDIANTAETKAPVPSSSEY